MNEHELADLLHKNAGDGNTPIRQAANLLLQQADRIAELEKDGKVCATCGGLVYDAVLPQTKPLSDEEIDNICQEIACECQHIQTDEWIYRVVARAIEERHGIK